MLPEPLKKLAVTKLPKLALPVTKLPVILAVPFIFAPVPVTTNTLALPTADILTLPLAAGMFTLLLPLDTPEVVIPVKYTPLPVKKLADTLLPRLALPERILANSVNVTTSDDIPTLLPNAISALLTSHPIQAIFALVS